MAIATTSNGEGGYDYQFVMTPSDMLVCKICHCPSREACLAICCGHTFCKSCLESAKRVSTVSDTCPVCRNEEFVTVPNKQVDRAVRNLHVFCTNKEKGCEWQGEVNDIVNHFGNSKAGCQFEEVPCSNGCGKRLQQRYLASHVEDECVRRKIDCWYCHLIGEHHFIQGEHKEQCPKLPIKCPNKCEVDNILRENIAEHRKMCPLEEVACPNGCGITLQQRFLINHSNTECPHLKVKCQHCDINGQHKFIENGHKEQCSKFPIRCPNKCKIDSVPREDLEEHMKMCSLEQIWWEYHVVGCMETMVREDQKKHNKENMEEHLSFAVSTLNTTK
ncbi:TNF receptor-associated factor 4-like [Dysidea avara]|uniref:TNF receptor-associated factor 4-like n=1 Tax=Dysidea avara TaxID=196820 RepID=UPI00331977A4